MNVKAVGDKRSMGEAAALPAAAAIRNAIRGRGPGPFQDHLGRLNFCGAYDCRSPFVARWSLGCREGGECEGRFRRFCHRQKSTRGLK
jgi:hypothetical protein